MNQEEIFTKIKECLLTDNETAHLDADELLKQALRLAASGRLSSERAKAFISLYDAVGKWYS